MTGFSSQLGKAILGRTKLGSIQALGSVTTTQTITGVARITGATTGTITGVSRITASTTRTIDGTYLIYSPVGPVCTPLTVAKIVPIEFLDENSDEPTVLAEFYGEPCERKGS